MPTVLWQQQRHLLERVGRIGGHVRAPPGPPEGPATKPPLLLAPCCSLFSLIWPARLTMEARHLRAQLGIAWAHVWGGASMSLTAAQRAAGATTLAQPVFQPERLGSGASFKLCIAHLLTLWALQAPPTPLLSIWAGTHSSISGGNGGSGTRAGGMQARGHRYNSGGGRWQRNGVRVSLGNHQW